jgi:hypothetical protein
MAPIIADGIVAATPEEVFAFLSRLENHWRLAGPWIDVVHLQGSPDGGDGGAVRIRGPLGLSRTARTAVLRADPPREMCGRAEVGSRTRARVTWTLAPEDGATRVHLEAEVEEAGALDRLLLSLGGEAWLRGRFRAVLSRLAELFSDGFGLEDVEVGPKLEVRSR